MKVVRIIIGTFGALLALFGGGCLLFLAPLVSGSKDGILLALWSGVPALIGILLAWWGFKRRT